MNNNQKKKKVEKKRNQTKMHMKTCKTTNITTMTGKFKRKKIEYCERINK